VQRLKKISTILLSALMLLSSTSYTFGMHFCMGELESIAIFSEAGHCDSMKKSIPCEEANDHSICDHEQINAKGCCENHTLVIEGHEELTQVSSISAPDFHMVAVLYALVSFIFSAPAVDYYSYKDYSPPLIDRDIPVLVQSFLI
tara:strand:- start:12289 stop:12723 length:435 start_codon:yes stop_codon:yes gene_type:complete